MDSGKRRGIGLQSAFWMGVLAELKTRGVQGILIACIGGLAGFPEVVRSVYPDICVQLCMRTLVRVHMVRNSTKFVSYKNLKKACADLKAVYSANSEEAGHDALEDFGEKLNDKYPMICKSLNQRWGGLGGFFKYPPEIWRAIYTANAIETMNCQLRKVTKKRSAFLLMALYLRYCI